MKDICKRCGLCCELKRWDPASNLYFRTGKWCPQYLRLDNCLGFCKIYPNHTGTIIGNTILCLSVEQMIEAGLAPQSCAYVQKIPNYICRVVEEKP